MIVRPMLAGALLAMGWIATGLSLMAWATPTTSIFGPLARVLDAFAPAFLGIATVCAIMTLVLKAWRHGLRLGFTVFASIILHYAGYHEVTRPVQSAETPDISVLYFNAFADNAESGARIVEAAMATGADMLIFAEAAAISDDLGTLREAYGFVSDCPDSGCELLVATNLPVLRHWQMQLNPAWAERYAVTEVDLSDYGPVFVAAVHLAKPWMSGLSEAEHIRAIAQLNWLSGPAVVVGDFNMPPWSQPMRQLLEDTGFRAPRWGRGTWPATAPAPFRLPIDHVLLRSEQSVTDVTPFGADLGSNHLGFVAEVALP